ncbi:MAG: c-type cytochrome [Vicinamibacteria bacterium]
MLARVAFLLLMLLKAAGVVAHEPSLSRFNYGEHVLPIFQRHCAGCHRSGGAGPMSLLDYQEAVPWANAIKLALLEGRMPPFLPSDESGPFQHARTLTAEELDVLVDWSVGATPQGEPIEEEAPRVSDETPTADLVLRAPSEIVLDEDEYEKTACVVFPSGLEHPRIATSFELVSRTPSILRRATVFLGDSCAADAEPFGTWLPDQGRVSYPGGFGREIPADSSLALELRYVKSWEDEGRRMGDQTALGLWFSDDAAIVRAMRITAPRWSVKEPRLLTALYPAPADESPLRVELVLPDGGARLLLAIESFDAAWSEKYFFREPVLLPVGSQIRVSHPVVWADLGEP